MPSLFLLPLLVAMFLPLQAQEWVEIPTDTVATHLLKKVEPVYPPFAKVAGIQGTVRIAVGIYTDGKVHSESGASGPAALLDAAGEVVLHYVYQPFEQNGKLVNVTTTIEVPFELPPAALRSYPAPHLTIAKFNVIWDELGHPLSNRMQRWLQDDLTRELKGCREGGGAVTPVKMRNSTAIMEIPGSSPGNSAYLVSRRASCDCGAQGSNCPIKFVQETATAIRLIAEEGGWGVAIVKREGTPFPDVFFSERMGAAETEVHGFAYIGGLWGQLYCGKIRASYGNMPEVSDVHECR